MRHSQQRDVILSVLRASTAHPTAEQIYEAVREVLPNVSLGTVYRNIRQLADNGEILTLETEDTRSHYDGNTPTGTLSAASAAAFSTCSSR